METTTSKREARKKKLFASKADELEVKRRDLISRQKEEIAAKKAAFLVQREKHRTVKEKLVAFNPYASTVGKLAGSRTIGTEPAAASARPTRTARAPILDRSNLRTCFENREQLQQNPSPQSKSLHSEIMPLAWVNSQRGKRFPHRQC